MDGILEMILGMLFPGLNDENSSVFEGVVKTLSTLPLPDLANPDFRAQYAVMWGLGIVLSIVFGFFAAVFALGKSFTSIGTPVDVGMRITFFVQTATIGFLATPVLHLVMYTAYLIGNLSLPATGHKEGGDWGNSIVKMFNTDSGLDFIIKEFFVWLIKHEVSLVQYAIPVMVMCTSAAFAFSVLGKPGQTVWRGWWAMMLTLVIIKPVLQWIFAICAWIVESIPSSGDTSISLFALFIACITPPLLLWVCFENANPPVHPIMSLASAPTGPSMGQGGQMVRSGNVQGPPNKGKLLAGASLGAGWLAGKHANQAESAEEEGGPTPRKPGTRRVATANFALKKAAVIGRAHPVGATALALGSIAVRHSGKRAAIKKGPGTVNHSMPQKAPGSNPMQNVYRGQQSKPPSSKADTGNTLRSTPLRAPHEIPTTRRPSLGRIDKRKR